VQGTGVTVSYTDGTCVHALRRLTWCRVHVLLLVTLMVAVCMH
jgi:hypothetical protein